LVVRVVCKVVDGSLVSLSSSPSPSPSPSSSSLGAGYTLVSVLATAAKTHPFPTPQISPPGSLPLFAHTHTHTHTHTYKQPIDNPEKKNALIYHPPSSPSLGPNACRQQPCPRTIHLVAVKKSHNRVLPTRPPALYDSYLLLCLALCLEVLPGAEGERAADKDDGVQADAGRCAVGSARRGAGLRVALGLGVAVLSGVLVFESPSGENENKNLGAGWGFEEKGGCQGKSGGEQSREKTGEDENVPGA
jgi:hypothetical protein